MNVMKKFLTALLILIGAVTLTACKPDDSEPDPDPDPEVTEYNALGDWEDGGDGVYTLNTNTNEELDFSYAKDEFTYAYMVKDVSDVDLSIFKKLVITVEGTGTMMLKLETADGIAKEVSLNVTGITGAYEWNLINDSDFLGEVENIVIFGAPGKTESTGDITVSQLEFSVDVAENYIIQTDFNNIPQNVNEYDGTSDTFDFNSKWENFAEDVYQISYVEDETVVSFEKEAGLEWSTMKVSVQGDFSEMNYIVFKVSGTNGQKFLAKPNNYNEYENFAFLNSDEQELVLDISDMPTADKMAITEIYVFGAAGVAASGEFTIHEAFFAKDYEYVAPVLDHNIYESGDTFDLVHWYDGGDLNYTISKDGTDTVFDYTKTGEWTFALAHIDGDLSEFDYVEIVVTGENSKTALFKVEGTEGAIEEIITFDGTEQTFMIDISTMTGAQRATINKFLVFAAQGSNIGSGTFTIHSATFKQSGISVNDLWVENDADTYGITLGDTLSVDYTKGAGQEWAYMVADFEGLDMSQYNTLTMTVNGTAGDSILIKPNDDGALEQTITFDGNPITITFVADEFTKIILFAQPGTADVSGSFEIIEAVLTTETYEDPDLMKIVDFTLGAWVENDPGTYMFTEIDGEMVVDYTKGAGQEWVFGKIEFDAEEVAGLNTLTLTLSGIEGKQVLLKPNDDGALEQWVTFGTEPVTVVITAESFSNIIFFAEAGTAEVSGSFTIESATLSYQYMSTDWVDGGDGTYTITNTDGVLDVDYAKSAGQEWSFMRINFDAADVEGLNTLTLVLNGTAGKSVLIKPNDNGAFEQTVTFDGNPVTVSISMEDLAFIILFAEPGTTDVSGSFEIISTKVSYEMPDVDFLKVVDFTLGAWVENDAGTYTFTETDGTMVVDYTKAAGQEWVFGKIDFDEEEAYGMNTLTLVLSGTEGKQVLLKPNDDGALEQWVTFGTEPVTVVVNADSFTNLIFFAEAGTADVSGSFTIESATLSYSYLTTDWVDGGDAVYTIVETDGVVDVDYVKDAGQEWTFMRVDFDSVNVAGLNTLTLTVNGTVGKTILVKPNDSGAMEQTVTFDGEPITLTFTAEEFTTIIIFAEGGTASVTDSFQILSTSVSYVEPEMDLTTIVDFTLGAWVENDAGTYTFTETDGTMVVDYTKAVGQEWVFGKIEFDSEEVEGLNTLTLTLSGTEGEQVLLKPNDDGALEQWVTFGTEPVTVVVNADSFTNLVFFAEAGTADISGSFTIESAMLSYTYSPTNWIDNGDGTYTVDVVDGVATIDYVKTAGHEWSLVRLNPDPEMVAGLNTVTMTLSGTEGKQVLVKPNDDGALEQWVTFGTEPVTITVTAESFSTIILFAEAGTTDVSGTFTVEEIIFSYTESN